MQSGPSKLLHHICAIANRSLQLKFHTSACAFKANARNQKKSYRGRGSPSLTRSPARKRLVSNLRPSGRAGTYEIAPRERSRPVGPPEGREPERDETVRTGRAVTREFSGRNSSKERRLGRENAPGRGSSFVSESPRGQVSYQGRNRSHRNDAPPGDSATLGEYPRNPSTFSWRARDFGQRGGPRRSTEAPNDSRLKSKYTDGTPGGRVSRDPDDGRYGTSFERPRASKSPVSPPEFDTPPCEPLKTLPSRFTSPPLLEGLYQSVHSVLGADAKPSPIQSLSLKHLFAPPSHIRSPYESEESETSFPPPSWSQYLLASETGSGKSIAYLLPMIQYLKLTEHSPAPLPLSAPPAPRSLPLNPRGIILAPTHELSRQLSSFAKALLHHVRLRVLCTSRANTASSSRGRSSTARQLKRELDDNAFGMADGAALGARGSRPVDILVGTPTKVLEMVRGWGWNKKGKIEEQWDDARKERSRAWIPGPPEAGLANIEWVVVDEADVLFDPDFQESTRLLLADISRARGYIHPSFSSLETSGSPPPPSIPTPSEPLAYPFHFLLTSATIPSSLATYLTTNHPTLTRLASPNLHHLPPTLKTEHHGWTSGNKNSDIEKRLKRVWAEDASIRSKAKSKVLIFCNKSTKVDDLGLYLKERGIPNVALTSSGQARHRGSNRHLAGFLKTADETLSNTATPPSGPHVMITTSLLSRGLDFSPQIKHVFIVDEPRNMIDFLHRAGRSGRAGHEGKVVVFGRAKGRGAGNAREVKRKVGALVL